GDGPRAPFPVARPGTSDGRGRPLRDGTSRRSGPEGGQARRRGGPRPVAVDGGARCDAPRRDRSRPRGHGPPPGGDAATPAGVPDASVPRRVVFGGGGRGYTG